MVWKQLWEDIIDGNQICVERGEIKFKDYGYDKRIGWDTYIVLAIIKDCTIIEGVPDNQFLPIGFTNGKLEEEENW